MMNRELLQIADAVAREKGIDMNEVVIAMEEAIQKVGKSKYGMENDIRAKIDRKTGEVTLGLYREVIDNNEEIENVSHQITIDEAKKINPEAEVGTFIVDILPPVEFGRIAANTARQIISQRVRFAEREHQYNEYKDRIGDITSGTIRRNEYGNYIVDIGRCEALLHRDECIPRENFRPGDRIRCLIMDVRQENRGPQVFLSRAHPNFMAQLFTQEVPEISEGTIDIISVARDPGSRAKIAVRANDPSIDPIGACVGMRGSRVQAVVNELQGEKVDIVPWTEDRGTFIINALAPAEITKVVIDEENNKVDVVVPEDQQSLAIGRRGQNVRLGSLLTKMDISILTEEQEEQRRSEEYKGRASMFSEALEVDDVIAHLLVTEGFTSIEEMADTEIDEFIDIEGFDEDVAKELKSRSMDYLKKKMQEGIEKCKKLGADQDLIDFDQLPTDMIVTLVENDVKTLDDLADLAGDELQDILGEDKISLDHANEVIMAAREHWFQDEK
jgi:N utilization substance protein A